MADDCKTEKEAHRQLLDLLHTTYIKKNKDYGDSASKTFEEFGMVAYALRLTDKLNRFKQLTTSGEQSVSDESVVDTLLDLANYSLMAIIDLTNSKKKEGKNLDGK